MLTLSIPLTAKERRGADLIIQRTDGTGVRGELIAVKQNSLLLMERDSGGDVTVDVGEISVITHVKKSKLVKGAGLGFLIGGGIGAGIAILSEDGLADEYGRFFVVAVIAGTLGGIGLIIGAIAGAGAGQDKIYQVKYSSDSEIREILEKLHKKARIRNSR